MSYVITLVLMLTLPDGDHTWALAQWDADETTLVLSHQECMDIADANDGLICEVTKL